MKNTDNNITNNIKNDVPDVPVAGTDLFADSEDFLNELTDSELVQVRGGLAGSLLICNDNNDDDGSSTASLMLCG